MSPRTCSRGTNYPKQAGRRVFVHFGAVNYHAVVYLNGARLGEHEGGFTPFQFELTERLREKGNTLIVKVDNTRRRDGVPTVNTDWWNYGGITRDVLLVEVPQTFVRDWRIELAPGSRTRLRGFVQLDGPERERPLRLRISEAGVDAELLPDASGRAAIALAALASWLFTIAPARLVEIAPRSYQVFRFS